jgi:hypothetical protein
MDGPDCLRLGDLLAWSTAGLIQKENLIPLLELWRNPPRTESKGTRVFISTGSALLDNLTIAYLLEHLPADRRCETKEVGRATPI